MIDYSSYYQVEWEGEIYLMDIDPGYPQTHDEPGYPPGVVDIVKIVPIPDSVLGEETEVKMMNKVWEGEDAR